MERKTISFAEKLGVDPEPTKTDKFGFTHLHWAVIDKDVSAVQYLLSCGADAQAVASNVFGVFEKPPLSFRKRMKRFGVRFEDANFWAVRELTPLHIAASVDSVECMKFLFEYGAAFETSAYPDLNPVHCALCAGSDKALRALLRNGFAVDAKDRESRTMLHWLAMYRADSRVAIFLGGQFSRFGMKLQDPARAVRIMLEHGATFDQQDEGGNTPLHLAASTNMSDVAEVLLDHGAPADVRNFSGATPLHLAAWFNSPETADLLLARGAQIDSRDSANNTPLHIATADDAQDTHDSMIPYGSCCSRRGKNVVINLLVEHGAQICIENVEGHTPLSIAESKRTSSDTFDFLSQQRALQEQTN
ncbi:MAG: ankyrin repeat domain-containing protein [Acidiferrobacterales bacterium]|nr:ankyrin repeat domain-containing protein [Acidiferrobacterales bacterium]